MFRRRFLAFAALSALLPSAAFADTELLNVSYDPTRELYQELNEAFAKQWQAKTGKTITIQQSHGGSGKQARADVEIAAGEKPIEVEMPAHRVRRSGLEIGAPVKLAALKGHAY